MWNRQHRFAKGKPDCPLWSKFLDERRAVDVIYLGFSKVFNTVSHSVLLSKLGCITFQMCEQPNGLKTVG